MTYWTTRDIATLKKLYPTAPRADLERAFGRSFHAIKAKANGLGLKRKNRWSQAAERHVPASYAFRRSAS